MSGLGEYSRNSACNGHHCGDGVVLGTQTPKLSAMTVAANAATTPPPAAALLYCSHYSCCCDGSASATTPTATTSCNHHRRRQLRCRDRHHLDLQIARMQAVAVAVRAGPVMSLTPRWLDVDLRVVQAAVLELGARRGTARHLRLFLQKKTLVIRRQW